ncbi:MAG: hypothetical protein Q9227_000812 [Pyrenula ochraceoflavens]
MLLPNRQSALKIFSVATFIAIALLYLFNSHIYPATDKEIIIFPVHVSPTTTLSTHITTHSQTALASQTVDSSQTTPSATPIPEKIWYKLGPHGVTPQAREWIDSCLNKNPSYSVEYMTDASADAYVQENFGDRPELVDVFLALPFPILKADLLRYLLLFKEGGIYNDLDVSCADTPIRDWVPEQFRQDANVVVGWEFDVGWFDGFMRQLATWTIMARPGSPHLLMVVDDILEAFHARSSEFNVTIADLTWTMVGDVVDLTGPRRMTGSIMKSLKATLGDAFNEDSVTALSEPKLVGDVLILPGYSFALSSNHYKQEETQEPVLVTHHFDGSWKNEHLGETADAVP